MQRDITFNVNDEKLVGTLWKAQNERASILMVSGGGNKSHKEGYQSEWQKLFLEKGITTFSFDFRGIGESARNINETSLNTRLEDAQEALEILRENSTSGQIYILGTSMGGPVTIRMADTGTQGILLIGPAAYSLEARDKNFGPEFSEAIRKPESWKNSPDFTDLNKYQGRILLIYGALDQVIPKEIFTNYEETVNSKGGKVIRLENATHNAWKTEIRDFTFDQIVRFIFEQGS